MFLYLLVFFFQAEDGIRDLVRSRGLGDVYKRQAHHWLPYVTAKSALIAMSKNLAQELGPVGVRVNACLLYTSDAADERSSVDLGGRRIIKKKNNTRDRQSESSAFYRRILLMRQNSHSKQT